MIFLQGRREGGKMIVILQKEIRTSQPVKQGEAIKPVPDEFMTVLSIVGIGNFSSLSSLCKVLIS